MSLRIETDLERRVRELEERWETLKAEALAAIAEIKARRQATD